MIKKLLLIFSFIILATIAFNGTTYAAQAGETIVITEELSKLNKLYIEGVITEEEFSKAKSILLNPDSDISKKKKKKLTAVERRNLEKLEKEELKAAKEAEKERELDEALEIERACADDPKGKGCNSAKLQLTKILEKIKIKSIEDSEKAKEERALEQKAIEEKKKRIAKQRELEKQASLEEKERNKAERAARKAERKRLKAEWKKACSDDPESKACKEGKPSEKIKKSLLKIKKKLGG